MDQEMNKFQNQPRLGAAIRQRSHSTKELSSMLQKLQLNVQLMPLNNQPNQTNLASTSEEESDSMNSNEISEDEAFGDFDDEDYDFNNRFDNNDFDNNRFNLPSTNNNLRTNKQSRLKSSQLANLSSSFSTGLVYPKLRRSNSLGSLLNYKQMNNEFYCDDDDDYNNFDVFSNEFNRKSSNKSKNDRNSLFRSTLPRIKNRYSTSLKENLNNLVDKMDQSYFNLYKSNQMFRVTNYLKNKLASPTKFRDNLDDNQNFKKVNLKTNNDSKINQTLKSDSDSVESIIKSFTNESINKSPVKSIANTATCKTPAVKSIESNDKHNLINSVPNELNNFRTCLNQEATNKPTTKIELKNECINTSNQLNHPTIEQLDVESKHLNSAATSSIKEKPLVGYSGASNILTSSMQTADEHINNKVNLNSSASSCKSSVEYSSSNEFKNPFQSEQQIEQTNSELDSEISSLDQNSDYFLNKTHLVNDRITAKQFDKLQSLDKNTNKISSNEFASKPSTEPKGFENCGLNLKDYLIKNISETKSAKRSNRIQLKSELPIVIEEKDQIGNSILSENKMQTLAETQYNQLNYHIAALSCVCDNNKNLSNQYSSFNSSQNQNSPSSVDSDEYSSPYNSPPSSPSSISSYSSAEEDCSILTPNLNGCLQKDLNDSNKNLINKSLSDSTQSLADLITADHGKLMTNKAGLDVVDCATVFNDNQSNQGILTTVDQLINDNQGSSVNQSSFVNTNASNRRQDRVRKTSILRNQTATDLANYCKKEVKFADTLGFALEKIKYFPPISPQVKPKRHSVNLASLQRDYYDEHQELFILHAKPQTADNNELKKQFEENYYRIKQSKLNQTLKNNQPQQVASNNFWNNLLLNYQTVGSSIREGYCGDMLFNQQPFEDNLSVNTQRSNENAENSKNNLKPTNLMNNFNSSINYNQTNSSLEFNPLNFMNNQSNNYSSLSNNQQSVSFLFLNFNSQPNIQSDFPHRLRSQSVLLHSLNISGNEIEGKISVMNLTFEKRIIVKYTLNKWVTERQCEATYFQKDCDNSDQFKFTITLNENDFPQFQLDEDRTMMFAIRYETGDRRIYWDNNFGQDYRLKCRFN